MADYSIFKSTRFFLLVFFNFFRSFLYGLWVIHNNDLSFLPKDSGSDDCDWKHCNDQESDCSE